MIYVSAKSLCCIPETNIKLYVNYIGIKIETNVKINILKDK